MEQRIREFLAPLIDLLEITSVEVDDDTLGRIINNLRRKILAEQYIDGMDAKMFLAIFDDMSRERLGRKE